LQPSSWRNYLSFFLTSLTKDLFFIMQPINPTEPKLMQHPRPEQQRSPEINEYLRLLEETHPWAVSRLSPYTRHVFAQIWMALTRNNQGLSDKFFFQTSINITELETHPERDLILNSALQICDRHWTLVNPYFTSVTALPHHRDFVRKWVHLADALSRLDAGVGNTFMHQTPHAICLLEDEAFFSWGNLALNALKSEPQAWKAVKAYLVEALDHPDPNQWAFLLKQAVRIAKVSVSGAEALLRFGRRICSELDRPQQVEWINRGVEGKVSKGELIQYFSGTSNRAIVEKRALETRAKLIDRINLLYLVCEANLGRPVHIQSNCSLDGVTGFTGAAATDGKIVYLPDSVPSFGLFKLMALHQSMIPDTLHRLEGSEKMAAHPIRIHLETDRSLLARLPGLRSEMVRLTGQALPKSYPEGELPVDLPHLPWWGDILSELIKKTDEIVSRLQQKALDHMGCAPELVEGMVTGMMAKGQREEEALWETLRCMFNTTELSAHELEKVPQDVKVFYYDEWDKDLSNYKKNWCRVLEKIPRPDKNLYLRDARERLRGLITLASKQFMRFKPSTFQKLRAQPYGDDLDIDSLIEAVVDKRAGSFLSENVYIRRDKTVRDVAVLFLLDTSASTEEKVGGRRVIDIQKDAVVVMTEALNGLGDQYALYGFNSDGRFKVNMLAIKTFSESGGHVVGDRLGDMEPDGLTRLGGAVRHATRQLTTVEAKVRLLIILTDGRPYDLDYGDLNYAVADTKKAVMEARKQHIHPFIITSDKEGADYLEQITRWTQSIVLPRVELLPFMLPAVYKRLTT
jgi:Mg-chelatase subunit ChlD